MVNKRLYILSIILIWSMSINNVLADGYDINIDPIVTQEQGLWYPGRIESKDFYITNSGENNINIDRLYIELKSCKDLRNNQNLDIDSNQFKELAKNSKVKLSYKNKILVEENLEELLYSSEISLSQEIRIKSNEKVLLNMIIDMNEEMNNDAQALENIFSIGVAYKIDDTKPSVKPEPPINTDTTVKPGTGAGIESDELPQTGGIVNSASLMLIGTVAVGTGIALNKKSSQEKGGKHHE